MARQRDRARSEEEEKACRSARKGRLSDSEESGEAFGASPSPVSRLSQGLSELVLRLARRRGAGEKPLPSQRVPGHSTVRAPQRLHAPDASPPASPRGENSLVAIGRRYCP